MRAKDDGGERAAAAVGGALRLTAVTGLLNSLYLV